MNDGDFAGAAARRHLGGDPFHDPARIRMSFVIDGENAVAVVMIAHPTVKGDDRAGGIVGDKGFELGHVDRLVGDSRPDHDGIRAVIVATVLDPPCGFLVTVGVLDAHACSLGVVGGCGLPWLPGLELSRDGLGRGAGRGVVAVVQLIDDMREQRADRCDRIPDAASRAGGVHDEGAVGARGGDAGDAARDGGGGDGRVVSHFRLDAPHALGDEWFGAFGGEVAAGDAGAAGGEDDLRAAEDRVGDDVADGGDAVGDDDWAADLAIFPKEAHGEGAGEVLAEAGSRAVGDGDDGDAQLGTRLRWLGMRHEAILAGSWEGQFRGLGGWGAGCHGETNGGGGADLEAVLVIRSNVARALRVGDASG